MQKFLTAFLLLISCLSFSQNSDFKEYSYTEFFQMIENEKDSVFTLKNALIKFTPKTDSINYGVNYIRREGFIRGRVKLDLKERDTLIINKELRLNNVQFQYYSSNYRGIGSIVNVKFLKPVRLINTVDISIYNCVFEDRFRILYDTELLSVLNNMDGDYRLKSVSLEKNTFRHSVGIACQDDTRLSKINIGIDACAFKPKDYNQHDLNFFLLLNELSRLEFEDNVFSQNVKSVIILSQPNSTHINANSFGRLAELSFNQLKETQSFKLENNMFGKKVALGLGKLDSDASITWSDFQGKIIHADAFREKMLDLQISDNTNYRPAQNGFNEENLEYYMQKQLQVTEEPIFKEEMNLRGQLFDLYKARHDNNSANLVYQEMKDLETERLEFLYSKNQNFKTYFTWKTNQFLKVFSAYGTEPARAIIFSMYVILVFALIYLFFPNSWDKHGRNRIVNRYNFFFKYMKRQAGIHEVYLDEQKEELMSYDQFKENITTSKQKVPKFFTATALPLYNWAISGTKLSASFLSKIDIMKGTWSELPKSKRIWKSILLIGAFLIAVLYDIFIKMLNALMLSINTFTTLGFGEIPIKGLPRYLAIIQGFIGWFMLTIFSVSLISQLLN